MATARSTACSRSGRASSKRPSPIHAVPSAEARKGHAAADRLTGIGAEPSIQDGRGALDLSLEHEDRSEADARDDEAVRRVPHLGDM